MRALHKGEKIRSRWINTIRVIPEAPGIASHHIRGMDYGAIFGKRILHFNTSRLEVSEATSRHPV